MSYELVYRTFKDLLEDQKKSYLSRLISESSARDTNKEEVLKILASYSAIEGLERTIIGKIKSSNNQMKEIIDNGDINNV